LPNKPSVSSNNEDRVHFPGRLKQHRQVLFSLADIFGHDGAEIDFVSVGSAFYPDLGLYYEEEAETWLAEQEVGEEEPPFR